MGLNTLTASDEQGVLVANSTIVTLRASEALRIKRQYVGIADIHEPVKQDVLQRWWAASDGTGRWEDVPIVETDDDKTLGL